jgi:Bifunctional DNA primase/polymerase, N-terminal
MNVAERLALAHAMKLGLPAFPCRTDKRPSCPHGYKDATLPEAGLATLWARHPGELIGVPTGAFSGIDVLDVDRQHGGGDWYAKVKAELPLTRLHRTRSGGLHVLFRHHAGLRNTAGKIARGVDVRADGGYMVWWPQQGLEVRDHPLNELPAWPEFLLDILTRQKNNQERAPTIKYNGSAPLDARILGIAKRVERAAEGERNNLVFWAACRAGELVRAGEVDDASCAALLEFAAMRAGLSPLEARRTIKGGFAR